MILVSNLISIVIPVYNRFADLEFCLASILLQTGCRYEVIIISDASSDGDYHKFADMSESVSVYDNLLNAGPSYSRNIGINKAKGEYVLFLDSDTNLSHPEVLMNFLCFFASHPEAGSVGGEIRVYQHNRSRVYGRSIANDGISREMSITNVIDSFAECDFLATCCCMVRTDIARRIGGFDPYYVFGSEDKDFGYRIRQLGYKNYVSADCAVEHFHSPGGRNTDETYRYHFTRFRFAFKHFQRHIVLFVVLKSIIQFFLFYVILPFKLVYLKMRGRHIVKENIIGGFLLLKALILCILSYLDIRKTIGTNFLAVQDMERFLVGRQGKA